MTMMTLYAASLLLGRVDATTNLDVCIGVGLDGKVEEAIVTNDVDLNLETVPSLFALSLSHTQIQQQPSLFAFREALMSNL